MVLTVDADATPTTAEGGLKIRSRYTHQAHDKDINMVTVAPNDKWFATGSQDKTAKVWSCTDGSLVGICKGHKRGVWCVRFSPIDQVLATSSGDKTIRLWSLADFSCIKVGSRYCRYLAEGIADAAASYTSDVRRAYKLGAARRIPDGWHSAGQQRL